MKKLIMTTTFVFLIFEVLYFTSNNQAERLNRECINDVYTISVNQDKKAAFLDDYANIILEENDNKIIVLTDKNTLKNINENYNVKID